MSEGVYQRPHRTTRGFRTVVARPADDGEEEHFEATHVTARPITLWYGRRSPTVLPAGTPVRVLDHDEHVVRFVYQGIDATHATAGADAVAGLEPTRVADSTSDASEDEWLPQPTAGSTPSSDSRRSSGARSPSATPPPSRSSRRRRSPTATGSSHSSLRRRPTSSGGSSSGSSGRQTSSGVDARTPLEQLLAGEALDYDRFGAALEHLADHGAFPPETGLELDLEAGTIRLAPSADDRSVPDIG